MIHIFVDGEHGNSLYQHSRRCGVPEPVLHLEVWDEARAWELIEGARVRAVVLPLERLSPEGLRRIGLRKTLVSVVGFQLTEHTDWCDGVGWGADLAARARANRIMVWGEQRQQGGFFAVNPMGVCQLHAVSRFEDLAQVTAHYLKFEA